MGFNRSGELKTESLCFGLICAWFDKESGSCAVFSKSVSSTAPKTTRSKKTEDKG